MYCSRALSSGGRGRRRLVAIEAGVEGSPVQAHIAISDIGISDVHSLTVRWGDGAETTQVVAASGEVVRDVELTHVYADNSPEGAPFVVEVVVTDDGVPFAAEPVLVEIANVGPSDLEIAALDHRGDPVVSGGDVLVDRPLAITVAFTDPGADEHTVTATVDGVTVGMVMESDGGYAATLNPAEPGFATVEVTVIDDDGKTLRTLAHTEPAAVHFKAECSRKCTITVGQHTNFATDTIILAPGAHDEHIIHRCADNLINAFRGQVTLLFDKAWQMLG